jgi:acyl carrier protein
MTDEIRAAICAFVVENFLFGDDSHPLSGELSLIDNDLIDSTGILELVGFLEEHFAITVADADIVPANLDTIDRIADFITRKRAS